MTADDRARTTARPHRTPLLAAALTATVLTAAATAPPWTWAPPDWLDRLTGPAQQPPPAPATTPTPIETPAPAPPDPGGIGIGDVLLAATGLLLLVLALLLARTLLTAARRGTQAATPATTPPGDATRATPDDTVDHLRDAVHHAQEQLAPRVPPRDAVVAAWVALEDAAALAGARRDPAQTPTEFTVAVLGRTPADPGAVAVLRRLYQRARFSRADVSAHDVEDARSALRRLSADLAVEPSTVASASASARARAGDAPATGGREGDA
jgi:hypothetical protein